MATATEDWLGQTLCDRYVVRQKLGEGGMGAVLRAFDSRLETDVVIKVPRRELLHNQEFVRRFQEEIRALVKLTHPHVVKVTDADVHRGVPFAVLQYLAGGSLESRRQAAPGGRYQPAPPRSLGEWLPQVSAALDFLHKQNYVHRDVKPANILFDEHGNAYLGDFGVVKALAAHEEDRRGATLTGTGLVLGTPQYMSPELIMGQPFDGRSDQYALAVVAYELLCGRRPFEADAPSAILVMHTAQQPPPPRSLVASIPAAVSQVLLRGLAKRPGERYASCEAFTEALLAAVAGKAPAAAAAAGQPRVSTGEPGHVACPACGRQLKIKSKFADRVIACPYCPTALRVSATLDRLTEDPAATARLASKAAAAADAGSAPPQTPTHAGPKTAAPVDTHRQSTIPTPTAGSAVVNPKHKPSPTAAASGQLPRRVETRKESAQISPVVWGIVGVAAGVLILGGVLLLMPQSESVANAPQAAGAADSSAEDQRAAERAAGDSDASSSSARFGDTKPGSSAGEDAAGGNTEKTAVPFKALQASRESAVDERPPVEEPPFERPATEPAPAPVPRQPVEVRTPPSAGPAAVKPPLGEGDRGRAGAPAAPTAVELSPREEILATGKVKLASGQEFDVEAIHQQINDEMLRDLAVGQIPRNFGRNKTPNGVLRLSGGGVVEFRGVKMRGRGVFTGGGSTLAVMYHDDKLNGTFVQMAGNGAREIVGDYRAGRPSGVWCYFVDGQPSLVRVYRNREEYHHLALADRLLENVDLAALPGDLLPAAEWRTIERAVQTADERHVELIKSAEDAFEAEAKRWLADKNLADRAAQQERDAEKVRRGNEAGDALRERQRRALGQ